MQKVTGVEQSKDILSKNRGLDLEGDPKYISQFSEAIFGEKMNLLDYVKEILGKVKADGDKAIYGNELLNITETQIEEINIDFFPNPVKELLVVLSPIDIQKITIYNMHGIKVKVVTKNFNEIAMTGISSGILLVAVETKQGVLVKKVIKE